ncbi:MAG: histidinol dehydrogenase, partial [Kiloniellales bacterium]
MPRRLRTKDPDFEAAFQALVEARRETDEDVSAAVAAIIADVRARGDAALIDHTRRFDRLTLTPQRLRIGAEEIAAAVKECDPETLSALRLAAERIEDFHRRQLPEDLRYDDRDGVSLGVRWTAMGAVGLYVPGGAAAYPSSVLMTALPARVAGVGRVAMAVPAPDGVLNPLVLAAAEIAGVEEIYRVGGAQAVAALAYGTQTIAPVDKVVGPGGLHVAAAKRQVFGHCGVDLIAGPSEILVVADGLNDPAWIAADLLAQAEHDAAAQAVLMTDDGGFAAAVIEEAAMLLRTLDRADIAGASWEAHGAVIELADLGQAVPLIDRLAPEHLALAVADPEPLAAQVRNAGAIFLGRLTPEAIGD